MRKSPNVIRARGTTTRVVDEPISSSIISVLGLLLAGMTVQSMKAQNHANRAGSNVAEDGRRSTSAYIFTLGGGPISWSSKRQHTVATSSCEAEYIGQCNATKEAVWLRLLLRETGYPVEGPTVIFADNKSAIALANTPAYHGRSRHIDIQYHYTREKVNNNTVQLLYLPTTEMVADGLTKPLGQIKHKRFINPLGLQKSDEH
jgi:hypothetical protein